MKWILIIAVFLINVQLLLSLSCKPYKKKTPLVDLVIKSDIVVKVKIGSFKKKGKIHNATATVTEVFQTRSGGLKQGSTVSFGLVGKHKDCTKVKAKRSYVLFLEKANQENFYPITFNPVKASSKTVRKLKKKILCKNCLIPASFKKRPKPFYKKDEGKSLKLRCKASGNPKPTISWYYNNEKLTKANTPKGFVIKNNRKGGSGRLVIKELEKEHDKKVIICSATNALTPTPVNFTMKIKLTNALSGKKCEKLCHKNNTSYCFEGQCCQVSHNSFRCRCPVDLYGERCENKVLKGVSRGYSEEELSLKYRHSQRMVAILGMGLALMFVLFLCFSVYCLFKRRRTTMLYEVLKKKEETSSTAELKDEDETSNQEFSGISPTRSARSRSDGDANESGSTNAYENSSTPDHNAVVKKNSIHSLGGGSGRGRLNGVRKDVPCRSPASRMCASRNNSPLLPSALSNSPKANDLHQNSSLTVRNVQHSHQEAPSLPLNSPLVNILAHQSPASVRSGETKQLVTSPGSDATLITHNDNYQTKTAIDQDNLSFEDGASALQSSISSHGSPVQIASSSSNRSNLTRSVDQSMKRVAHSNNSNNNQSRLAGSDNDDLFVGMEIPDTSLGLYASTPEQSLERLPLRHQQAVDSGEPHYATPVVRQGTNRIPVSPQSSQQLPFLPDNRPSPSLSDSTDDSDTPQIEV